MNRIDAPVDIKLRDFRPRPMLKVAEHHPQRFPVPTIDAHNHLGRWLTPSWSVPDVGALIAMMDRLNIGKIVNLDGSWGEELDASLARYDRAHPGRFATFCRLDWSEAGTAGWARRLANSVRESASRGAKGLKLWKDIGLRNRDENGALIFLDDPRLAPIWEEVAAARLPVLVHIADPAAFFEPLDAHNERIEELIENPDWHFYGPEFPGLERLLASLEICVAANPGITFIGAHVGCYAEDLGWVGRMLTTYPNFNIDISARIAELGRQPRAARRLMLEHADRVVFGTDVFPPQESDYLRYLRFLSTEDEHFPYSDDDPPGTGRWMISGVHLPEDVLTKLLTTNAARILAPTAERS